MTPNEKPAGLTEAVYKNVVAKYCRTCHIAQTGPNDVESLSVWSSKKGITRVDNDDVAVADYTMPYAEVPFNAFCVPCVP